MDNKKTARATVLLSEIVYSKVQNKLARTGVKFSTYVQQLIEQDLEGGDPKPSTPPTILTDLGKELGGEHLRNHLDKQLAGIDQPRELTRLLYARASPNWRLPVESLGTMPPGLLSRSEAGEHRPSKKAANPAAPPVRPNPLWAVDKGYQALYTCPYGHTDRVCVKY